MRVQVPVARGLGQLAELAGCSRLWKPKPLSGMTRPPSLTTTLGQSASSRIARFQAAKTSAPASRVGADAERAAEVVEDDRRVRETRGRGRSAPASCGW